MADISKLKPPSEEEGGCDSMEQTEGVDKLVLLQTQLCKNVFKNKKILMFFTFPTIMVATF